MQAVSSLILRKFKAVTTDAKRKVTWEIEQQFGNSTNKNDCICKQPGQLKAAVGGGDSKSPALSPGLRSTHMQAEASRLPSVFWVFSLKPTLPPPAKHEPWSFLFSVPLGCWLASLRMAPHIHQAVIHTLPSKKNQLNRNRCQRPGAWWSLPLIRFQVCLCAASQEQLRMTSEAAGERR